ncbi:hypothetical protein BGZ70_008112 [Mortierella alpina]|uniref:WD40 repeat-like protein n=1 Tax=Mortierella alpina TaxID=64518 RepID=A0A9P6JE56_MORAP|nr:hypothetical protein BGZ70_008112 [Mortierella alpina]
MADSHVEGIDRENLHQPLYDYLKGLKDSSDPYLVFQVAYAVQALLCVPNDETLWQATERKAGRIVNGVFQLVGAVKALDVNSFIDGLCTLQNGAKEIYDAALMVKSTYSDVQSLCSSGMELRAALEDVSFRGKRSWYQALRGADAMLRNGQLAEFKKLVCEAPCCRALAFQWGVCLRLGNLAVDSQWCDKHRNDAVAFLGHLYRDEEHWGHHVPVKQLILDILIQLLKASPSETQATSKTLLGTLRVDGSLEKRAMFLGCLKSCPSPHPLMPTMSPPSSATLLDRAQGRVDVEVDLKRLRLACEQRRGEAVYIAPMAKASLQSPDTDLFDLKEKADFFLANEEQKVLLLLGESGVGKSTFNMELEVQLWSQYEKSDGRIPLFINLPAVVRPEQDLIVKQLRKLQFEESQIRELKKRKFVLICDGYDESQQTQNLYTSNRLNQKEEWRAQMVISCRSEYVGVDYKDRFQPGDRDQPSIPGQFHEAVVMPFSEVQIEKYIENFVDLEQPLWSAEKYISVLTEIPSLRDLVKNPFLLKLSLGVLPRLVELKQNNLAADKVTRVELYDQFVEQWLERGKKRLFNKDLSEQERRAFQNLSDEGFALQGIAFLKRLAADVYQHQDGIPVIAYSHAEDKGSWKHEYFSRDDHTQLLRDACPLTRSGNQYRFIHRSILEYGVARAVFEPQNGGTGLEKTELLATNSKRRCSVDSAYSFEVEGALQDNAVSTEQRLDLESPLARRSFVSEPSVLQFLEERAQQEPVFKKQLHAYIHASKDDKKWRIAAANAITILVRAGEQFNGLDLQRIQIPGADLSFGVFNSAELQGADLRKVKLANVWLSKAKLNEARMSGVSFGELEAGAGSRCVYSPNGNTLMTILKAGGASVYSTLTWELKWEVDQDIMIDSRVAYSPKSDFIASFITIPSTLEPEMEADCHLTSKIDTSVVYVWETGTGNCRILRGHTAQITTIAYSPRGDMIASCSEDKTIRLWNTTTNTCSRALAMGSDEPAISIAFSPKGDRLVSAHGTSTARLWDLESEDAYEQITLSGPIMDVIYFPAGTKIALTQADNGRQLYIWDVRSKAIISASFGWSRVAQITSPVISPRGDSLAISGDDDGEVKILDVETGSVRYNLRSEGERFQDAAFSPKGDLLVTGGEGLIVQLWDVDTGVCRGSMSGHSGVIRSVVFSPDGQHIASCGDDSRMRLWDVEAGMTSAYSRIFGRTRLSVGHGSWGDSIFSVNGGDTVYVWNIQSGARLQSLTKSGVQVHSLALLKLTHGTWKMWKVTLFDTHTGSYRDERILAIAYSPKDDQFASIFYYSSSVRLWNVELRSCRDLEGHTSWITSIVYSPTGGEIASASDDNTIRLWDTSSGLCRLTLSGHEDMVYQTLYSPNGEEIASCSSDGKIRLWSLETGICRSVLISTAEHSNRLINTAYSPAGDVIVSVDRYGKLQLWNVETGICMSSLQDRGDDNPRPRSVIPSIRFSPRSDLVAISAAYSGEADENTSLWKVRLWSVTTGEIRRSFKSLPTRLAPVFSPDGSRIACPETKTEVRDPSGEKTGASRETKTEVRVWDVETEGCLLTLGHEGEINVVKYSTTGQLIASASEHKTVKLWDAETGVCLHMIQDHRSSFTHLAFSPEGDRIVLGTASGFLRLWDVTLGTTKRYFGGHGDEVNCVVFSPNKYLLASASDDTTVGLWDLEAGSPWHVFEGHTDSVQCVIFSPTGTHVVSGSKDKTIRLWDIEARTCSRTMTCGGGEVWCLAYSPDGNLLASGSSNTSVYLWDVASGESWAVIEGTHGSVSSIAWRIADGASYLITGCSDSSVRVWRVIQEEDKRYSVILHWSSSHRALFVAGCDLQGVRGLSGANKRLLKQRGAFGDPQVRKSFSKVGATVLATSRARHVSKDKTAMSCEE